MSGQLTLSDYGKRREEAVEKLRGLGQELKTATAEEKLKIQSYIDAVELDIRGYNTAIEGHLSKP